MTANADTLMLPYQTAWIRDTSRLKLMEKSRQIGWTWATAYGLVARKALKTAALDAWISSRDDIQARLFLEDCKAFAKILHAAAQDIGERILTDDQGKSHSVHVISFANGQPLHSLSSNPDAFAGRGGSFGEAAAILGAANPVSVVAMRDSHVLAIERGVLLEEMGRNPRLAFQVMRTVSQRLLDMVRDTETCHIRSSVDRVICYLKHQVVSDEGDDMEFEFPAHKKEIAANLSIRLDGLFPFASDLFPR
jgi:CRP-like cAMP-binding protein